MRYQVKRPDPSIPQPPRLLSTKAAAQLLGVSPATLRSWRLRGQGPAWIDLGPSPGDMVRVKVKNGRSINDVLGQTPTANLSPAFDQMDQTLDNEILYRLGMPQYARGVAGSSQVATELALVE